MSYFRRTRNSDDENEGNAQRSADSEQTSIEKLAATEATLAGSVQDEPGPRGEDAVAYQQVGEHVTAVLSSAQQAADRLRVSATEEAERIRDEGEDYAAKTRAAADAYVDEGPATAETEAGEIISEAEQRAHALREAAQKEAVEAQRDAVERRKSLVEEAERSEERLRNLLDVFRAITQRLETLVGEDAHREADDRRDAKPERSEEDLADALMLERRSSDSESRPSALG